MHRTICLFAVATWAGAAAAADLAAPLKAVLAVGPEGAGHEAAAAAWQELARAEPADLPTILAAMDQADPLAMNWLRAAVEAVADRALQTGRKLPAAELERFLLDRNHAPRARRLAYECLLRADATAEARLLPGMLDDPSIELRRDAVARLIAATDAKAPAAKPAETAAGYRQALAAARDLDQIKLLAERLRKLGEKVDLPRHFGFVAGWRLIGPFDNTDDKGFDAAYPPENAVDPAAVCQGKHGPIRWVEHTTSDDYGLVDLNKALGEEKAVVAYAAADFNLAGSQPRPAEFRFASYNAVKLWVNGRLLAAYKTYHSGSQFDQYVARAELQPGRNAILLKVCQNAQTQEWARHWAFQLRICDAAGGAIAAGAANAASIVAAAVAAAPAAAAPVVPAAAAPPRGYSIPLLDLDADAARQVVVDREAGQYLGHPTTVLLEDGKTILCVYPKGHGRGAICYKRSDDGGKTWSQRLPTPASWETSKETPTIHRVIDAAGTKRLIVFSGLYPIRMAVSDDDGRSWSELKPIGEYGGIVAMGCVFPLKTGQGHYMAMFHDDGRFFAATSKRTPTMTLYQVRSTDGGLTWSAPERIFGSADIHLCEPGVVRSPDGKQLAVLLRENRRVKNSHAIFSDDEGRTWSKPRELPGALTGDRHTAVYAPDGRLFISFRDTTLESSTKGDWVAWVGRYEDIAAGREGQYRVRLKDNHVSGDCAYPGVEILPDGTIVTVTYGHWTPNEKPYVLCVRLKLAELDALAAKRAQR